MDSWVWKYAMVPVAMPTVVPRIVNIPLERFTDEELKAAEAYGCREGLETLNELADEIHPQPKERT